MPPEDEVQHLRALVVELAQHVDLQELPAITIEAVALEDFPLIFDNDYKARAAEVDRRFPEVDSGKVKAC